MANMFCVNKSEKSRLRKLPLLPRVGITVDLAGRQFTYKHVPLLETLLNARERGFSFKNLLKVAQEQFAEVGFPTAAKRTLKVVKDAPAEKAELVETKAATIVEGSEARPLKKAPSKAAARQKSGKSSKTAAAT